MNVATITMDRDEAREKLRATRARLHRSADAEYLALEAGYKALAEGTPLLSLSESVRRGGIDADGRPKFAIARADKRQVHFRWDGDAVVFDTRTRDRRGDVLRWGPVKTLEYSFAMAGVEGLPTSNRWDLRAAALVPIVPPDIREADPVALDRRLILWEVEEWKLTPPRDPLLLRHIGGDLYAVTGAWDLTELERAVMVGRRDG